MKNLFKFLIHLISIVLLTIITQIGGLVYLISVLFFKKTRQALLMFIFIYFFSTFLIVPFIAPFFGREKIKDSQSLDNHTLFTKIANRNYVTPELNATLNKVANHINSKYPEIKLVYLDANFPFFNGFPLLPHLSHNDGKKIDISFIYTNKNNILTNKKPSLSGYGVFEEPKQNEYNQNVVCENKGAWQYDFTKYLTFGTINKELVFSQNANRELISIISRQSNVRKIFIEPHLKSRLSLSNNKIRFHGCKSVRHDDHIHFQIN